MAKSKTNKSGKSSKRRKKKVNFRQAFLVSFMLLAMLAFIFSSLPSGLFRSDSGSNNYSSGTGSAASSASTATSGLTFKKEGELSFKKADGTLIRKINIEIAREEAERNLGLMHRRSLPEDSGMLFIMDRNEEQSFWMKNTYISLDIIYVNEQKEIVHIAERTPALSEAPIPSNAPAKYVVEVISGYCKIHGIEVGDRVEW